MDDRNVRLKLVLFVDAELASVAEIERALLRLAGVQRVAWNLSGIAGTPLFDQIIELLSAEAERGYDVDELQRRADEADHEL